MADIAGTNLAAGIVPFTTEDKYPTHFAEYGKGGWHSVATIADRDAIPASRLEVGMSVFVVAEKKAYTLLSFSSNEDGTTTTTWEALFEEKEIESATDADIENMFS